MQYAFKFLVHALHKTCKQMCLLHLYDILALDPRGLPTKCTPWIEDTSATWFDEVTHVPLHKEIK